MFYRLHKELAMFSGAEADVQMLVRRLESNIVFTESERHALNSLAMHKREFGAGQDIVREGDRPSQCCLLLEGYAHRYKIVGEGRRQIMSFHIPGDLPDAMSIHLATMDHNLGTLAACRVAFISHDAMRRLIRDHPRIGDALWRDTLIDSAIFREWMVGIGRRDARARIAHLFCEFIVRMETVGLAEGKSVRTPLTQGIIADALGLSAVHVNRVVQELRAERLITWESRRLTAADWSGLCEAAEFDPAYLHLGDADDDGRKRVFPAG